MRYPDATGAGSRHAEGEKQLLVRRRGRLPSLRLRDDDEKDDDDDDKTKTASPTAASPKTASSTSTKSPPSSPNKTSSSSSISSSVLTSAASTALASTTPPPPASTLPPATQSSSPPPLPPLPPPQTFGRTPPEQTPPAPAGTSIPQAAPAVTPTPQPIVQTPTTLSSLTLPSSSHLLPVVSVSPDQAQTQNAGSQGQVKPPNNDAAIVAAILAILGLAGFLGFIGWKFVSRRRKRQQEDAAPTKTEIYNYYASESDVKSSEISSNQSSRNPMPSWLKRQLSKLTQGEQAPAAPERPKEAKINGWMDRHTSKMLDPMSARASMVPSVASDLGPPPSISPASVVGGNRQSVLSEMGQIRRDAVPPPLDVGMVERANKMHQEQSERELKREQDIARAAALLEAPDSVVGQRPYPYA